MTSTRFLFVVCPDEGHVNRVRPIASELAERGHDVAWLSPRDQVRAHLDEGARVFDLRCDPRERLRTSARNGDSERDSMLALGLAALPAAEEAVEAFAPDALVVDRMVNARDQLMLAGSLAARRADLPWATATTGGAAEAWLCSPPRDGAPLLASLATFQEAAGVVPLEWPVASPHLVLVFSTPLLLGRRELPPQYRLVGPALGPREESTPFPWEELRAMPRVLVTLGSVYRHRGERFYAAVVEAFANEDVQVILSAPPELVPEVPGNVLVRPYVPQLALLPHVDAVVCHGGHNTVCEALAEGVPLVMAPIMDDQFPHARQVAGAGAGLALDFDHLTAGELRQAVGRVLREPRFRQTAARVNASFEAAGGATAAADAVESLVS